MNPRLSPTHLVFAALLLAAFPSAVPAQTPGWNWAQAALTGTVPGVRSEHAMAYDSQRGKTVLFGGNGNGYLNDTWEWNGTAWTQVALTGAVPGARHYHSMAYDSQRGKTILFGGFTVVELSDTWEWNGSTWTQVALTGAMPGARHYHSMAYDSQRGRTVLFGGNTSLIGSLNDTWEWNGTTWTQVALTGALPETRSGHAMTYDSLRGKTVLCGGFNGSGIINDTWEWNGSTWAPVALTGAVPGARTYHGLAYNGERGKTVLFGGDDGNGYLNDTWEWDGTTWTQLAFTGTLPGSRGFSPVVYDGPRRKIVLFGGYGNGYLNDTWELTSPPTGPIADIAYTAISTTATPPAITDHALAPLPTGGELLFGGTNGTSPQPSTYELQGGTWAQQFSLLNPMARTGHSILLDRARQNNVLFGGRNPLGAPLNDTWTWGNGQWTYLPQATAPSPRSEHRMTFDSASHTGLLFGGKSTSGAALGDFWSWNGTAWTQLNPATLPPARFAHGLAFDTYRSRTALYGGADAAGRLDDVWEWNGTDWAQVTPAPSPSGPWSPGQRQSFGMAYDPRSERVVVHGGETANGCMADAWSWNGASWTLHVTTGPAPTARHGEQLIHDPNANQLLLFAGGCGLNLTNDLWVLDLPVFWRSSAFGTGCVGSSGIPALRVATGATAVLGQTLQMELANVPAFFSTSFGVIGWQRETFNGQPLPFELSPFGLPGCSSWTSADFSYFMSFPNAQGIATWPIGLPNNALLLGVELNLQALSFEAPGFPRWASVSNGIIVRCGDR